MSETSVASTPARRGSRYIQDPASIIQTLKQLRDHRCTLSLTFEKQSRQFKARLLDVYEDVFLIENITPRDGLDLLKQKTSFTIAARSASQFAFIPETRIDTTGEERGLPYFVVPLPDNLLLQQRRRNERYELPLAAQNSDSFLQLNTVDGDTVKGKILDISAGGCRLEIPASDAKGITTETLFKPCQINISSMLSLESEAAIRHLKSNTETNVVECGVELTRMSIKDRRRLEHFIEVLAKNTA